MDTCAEFLPGSFFGKYPNDIVEQLEANGITMFVDLTCQGDKLAPYKCNVHYVNYPITDGYIPDNTDEFRVFVEELNIALDKGEKLYIHCRGGHGRSGVVVACILRLRLGIDSSEALKLTRDFHQKRKVMDERWRKMGSPQTRSQKKFVTNY